MFVTWRQASVDLLLKGVGEVLPSIQLLQAVVNELSKLKVHREGVGEKQRREL